MTRRTKMGRTVTDRLILRPQEVGDADVFRRLWTERDGRVPAHRRIDADGHPDVDDISAHISGEQSAGGSGLLTVQRRGTDDVIGYCGVNFVGRGDADEPELAFELLQTVHNRGYATEASEAVLGWAAAVGYASIRASVWEWNSASRRVLEKLGFVDSGRDGGPPSEHGRNILTVRPLSASVAEQHPH